MTNEEETETKRTSKELVEVKPDPKLKMIPLYKELKED